MIDARVKCLCVIIVVFAFGGCAPQPKIPIPSETVGIPTSTPSAINMLATDTPRSESTLTAFPTSSIESTLAAKRSLVSGWFPIPEIVHPESIDLSTARSFKGLRIPPLPDELVIELNSGMPYGEVPPNTIFYQLYLIRKGNARMLWLGVPFKETMGCCGKDTPHRIYDAIPFPPIEADSLLIPFVCTRNHESDIFLIVVAEPPEKSASATNIYYAWRIDQTSTTLQPVSTKGIECSPNW